MQRGCNLTMNYCQDSIISYYVVRRADGSAGLTNPEHYSLGTINMKFNKSGNGNEPCNNAGPSKMTFQNVNNRKARLKSNSAIIPKPTKKRKMEGRIAFFR